MDDHPFYSEDFNSTGELAPLSAQIFLWTPLRKGIDLQDPTPMLHQANVGCTQGEAEVDHHAAQAKADLFRRTTTTEVTSEEQNQSNIFISINHRVEL